MPDHSFHRGSLALDFVGTLGYRVATPEERVPTPAALARWLGEAGLTPSQTRLTNAGYARAIALREAIAIVLATIADGALVPLGAARVVERAATALPPPRIEIPRRPRPTSRNPLAFALARIAADAIDVANERAERLVRCGLPECRSLLLSGTTGERRKWCSMERCGNRAKVRAYRSRTHVEERIADEETRG